MPNIQAKTTVEIEGHSFSIYVTDESDGLTHDKAITIFNPDKDAKILALFTRVAKITESARQRMGSDAPDPSYATLTIDSIIDTPDGKHPSGISGQGARYAFTCLGFLPSSSQPTFIHNQLGKGYKQIGNKDLFTGDNQSEGVEKLEDFLQSLKENTDLSANSDTRRIIADLISDILHGRFKPDSLSIEGKTEGAFIG